MIRPDKHDRALDAINAVFAHARMMAASRADYEDLVAVDTAEYLSRLLLRGDDQTDHFREVLSENAQRFPAFQAALERLDRPA